MKKELKSAIDAAREAGSIIMNYYKSKYEIRDKSYHNPVTTADHAADTYLKNTLTNAYAEYGWLSEETVDTEERLAHSRTWVVDPLDGTKEFIEGVPHFVVSVALVEDGQPMIGVLYNPASDELFTGAKNEGAFLNGERLSCSTEKDFKKMIILNSRSETRNSLWEPYATDFKEQRAIGSVAYKLGLTSAAQADIFASLRPKNEWDICAGHCILREAGGEMVTLDGKQITYNNKKTLITPGLIASNVEMLNDSINLFKQKK
ncbi:MAG: 3'(2'),5'-bisphosphate nucleotidase CysQ [Planctomycetia bacterium]|nr:3'(2'),5'-bisphosphate nucleotidase CysQ [Planctomycetia bacterium]